MIRNAQTPDFKIEVMESDIDHMHLLIDYDPILSISVIVRHLKQVSSTEIWKSHEKFLKIRFWKHRTFWTKGYFVSSFGNASIDKITKYIEEQIWQFIYTTKDRVFSRLTIFINK